MPANRCAGGIEPSIRRIREHLEDLTLREAALRLGFLTAEQFDALRCPALAAVSRA